MPLEPGPTEKWAVQRTEAGKRCVSTQGIDTTNLFKLVSLDNKQIVFDIPRNAAVEAVILNQNLFNTDDSVLDNIEIKRSRQFFKVFVDTTLQRAFNLNNPLNELSGVQLTLGAP